MQRRLITFFLSLAISTSVFADQCAKHFSLAELQALKKENFVIQSSEQRNKIAIKLLFCLGETDPKIRDGIVYEATSDWLRQDLLNQTTVKTMFDFLINTLGQVNQDPLNFTQPFAALVLSEVLRVDRIKPYLMDNERQQAIDVTTRYMRSIDDYRGFDEIQGWRHAVAHTADVFLQLSLNKKISKAQLNQLLDAIKTQVSPQKSHFYIYGEPKRLAMPFIYIVLRGEHTEQELASYLESVAIPAPYADWQSVYIENKGLAKRHNTSSFMYSVFAVSAQSDNPALNAIKPKLVELIKKLG